MKKNNSNVQSKNTLMKRSNAKEEETKKIKIKIQTSPNDKAKVLHKFNSNKVFMEKKYSSINITPKNMNHNMNFTIEGPKHKKISSTIVTSSKNSNKKSTTYQKVEKEKITSFTNKPITTVQRESFSQNKSIKKKFISFNGNIQKKNIYASPSKNCSELPKTKSFKSSFKLTNPKPINVNIDVDLFTNHSESTLNSNHKQNKTKPANINIKTVKSKNSSKYTNKYNLTINTSAVSHFNKTSSFVASENSKRKTITTTASNNSSKLIHNNSNSMTISQTLHKYNTNNCITLAISKQKEKSKSQQKQLMLNSSDDNFSISRRTNQSISTSLKTSTYKAKIKVNRKPYQHLTTTTLPIKKKSNISINKNKSNLTSNNTTLYSLSKKEILYKYHKYLTQYEINELQNFKENVYYIGRLEQRKKKNMLTYINLNKSFIAKPIEHKEKVSPLSKQKSQIYFKTNFSVQNFDDIEGDYIIYPGEQLNYRYEIISILGKGSYGEAVKCLDHKTNEYVCIKIIKSNMQFHNQAKIEIKLLEYISKNDKEGETNIVKFYSHFTFRNHICLVFELLDINLFEYLKARDFVGLEMKKIRSYTTEILFALLFLKQHKIIHCDLKPENILLLKHNKNSVKVIDFGSSCFDKEILYSYIQSRFYRAPEVLLEQGYSVQIDMWSLGCILCELFTGVPIFPGEDERDQLNYIMEYIDVPPSDYINMSLKKDVFFDKNGNPFQIPNSNGKIRMPNTKTFQNFLKGAGDVFIDFIKRCLRWFPEYRMTPEDALMHRFITAEMTSEQLYQHKQKIKKIKNGLTTLTKSAKGNKPRTTLNSGRKEKGTSEIRRNSDGNKHREHNKEEECEHLLSHPTSSTSLYKSEFNKGNNKKRPIRQRLVSLINLND